MGIIVNHRQTAQRPVEKRIVVVYLPGLIQHFLRAPQLYLEVQP